jgi:hypothetical protein
MSWDDHYRRRAAVKSVLRHAERNPAAGLAYDHLPEARNNFADRRELLLALQYDWSQALWARIELLCSNGRPVDANEVARTAWVQCAAMHPVLRRLLDEHRAELGISPGREQPDVASPLVA